MATDNRLEEALKELQKINRCAFWRIIATGVSYHEKPTTGECPITTGVEIFYTEVPTYQQTRFNAPTLEEAMQKVREWKGKR